MAKYGYARVSTTEQNLSMQIDALKGAGVPLENIFEEKKSGKSIDRPELKKLLKRLHAGDELVIFKLDRLGRSTIDLINIVSDLQERKIDLKSLRDNIDTTTAQGKFFFTITAAYAELERSLIVERINEGIKSAKRRGVKLGRPRIKPECIMAVDMMRERGYPIKEACSACGISKSAYYEATKYRREKSSTSCENPEKESV